MEERLRLPQLDAGRYLAANDPCGELAYCWLDSLNTFTYMREE